MRADGLPTDFRGPPPYSANWPLLALAGNARYTALDRGDGTIRVLDYLPAEHPAEHPAAATDGARVNRVHPVCALVAC